MDRGIEQIPIQLPINSKEHQQKATQSLQTDLIDSYVKNADQIGSVHTRLLHGFDTTHQTDAKPNRLS